MRINRWVTGASLAALAAVWAGCGGTEDAGGVSGAGGVTPPCEDGGNGNGGQKDCECKVTGGGVDFLVNGVRFTFGLNALPREEGEDHGHITLQAHGDGEKRFGRVTDIVSCDRTEAGGTVVFRGFLVGDGTFTVTVVDNGEPGRSDTIAFSGGGLTFGAIALEQGGNIQVHKPKPGECPEE